MLPSTYFLALVSLLSSPVYSLALGNVSLWTSSVVCGQLSLVDISVSCWFIAVACAL